MVGKPKGEVMPQIKLSERPMRSVTPGLRRRWHREGEGGGDQVREVREREAK